MKKNKKLAQVYHYDLYGKRDEKYKFLDEKSVNTIEWNELDIREPDYFFVNKNYDVFEQYNIGFSISDLIRSIATGIQSERDVLVYSVNEINLNKIISDISNYNIDEFRELYKLEKDGRDWNLSSAMQDINNSLIHKIYIHYKPFDKMFTAYTGTTKGFMAYPRKTITSNYLDSNIGYSMRRSIGNSANWQHIFCSNVMVDKNFLAAQTYNFPLYLYPEAGEQVTLDQSGGATTPSFGHPSRGEELGRKPNLDMKLVGEIAKGLGLEFRDVAPWDSTTPSFGHPSKGGECREKESEDSPPVGGVGCEASRGGSNEYFTPIDLLDYIYAVLHSPTYREKYKEFLKIDFPRVPYPKDKAKFWQLVDLGSQIRQLHLLETADKYITSYPNDGTNIVERKMTKNSIGYEQIGDGIGRVWINDEQYFDGIPEIAWEFYIGGYQPAQKWLKDRQGRELNYEDINHYQKIIVALTETDRLMKEVDLVGVE
jgi:type ISP restriction-modification system protein